MMWHYSTANPYGCLQLNDMDTEALNSGLTRCIRVLTIPGTIIGHATFWPFAPLVFVCGIGFILSTFAIMGVQLAYYIASFFIWILIIRPILVLCGQEPTEEHMDLFCIKSYSIFLCIYFMCCCLCWWWCFCCVVVLFDSCLTQNSWTQKNKKTFQQKFDREKVKVL